jgi:serine/threonine protein kinase
LSIHGKLNLISGPDNGRSFRLAPGETLILGRGSASNTQINDPRVSRIHCRVVVQQDRVVLIDEGGSGGTLVGGVAIDRHVLRPGDVFQIGDTHIFYEADRQDEQSTLAPPAAEKPRRDRTAESLKNLVGQMLGDYQLTEIIAAGSSGMVFKGTGVRDQRVVAIKVLTPDPSNQEEQKDRFVRAMQTMIPVRHENIVRLYNAGKKGPYCWAAMEYVDGESLAQVIARIGIHGMLGWPDVWRVAVHVGRALHAASELKIVHRNVTPTNILRRRADGVCLLGDLMLAKALEGAHARDITAPAQLIGDVAYMSPERTRDSRHTDERSDIYGLGATLYALLTGRPPFDSSSLTELIRQVRDDPPVAPRKYQMAINEMFQEVVLRMLAKRPADRYQAPSQLLTDLDRIGKFSGLETARK